MVGKAGDKGYRCALLRRSLRLFELVMGKNMLSRDADQCDIQVIAVYPPQVSPLSDQPSKKDEKLSEEKVNCYRLGSNPSPHIQSQACLPFHHRSALDIKVEAIRYFKWAKVNRNR